MLHTQGTSPEKRGGPPQDRRASEWAQRCHLISPVTASLTRPDGTSCRYLGHETGFGGTGTIRSPGPGVVNFLTALFTRLLVPLASIDSTV
jgi:hypothetical protein